MANYGEGDKCWIVVERPDGANVHNWHWAATEHRVTGFNAEQLAVVAGLCEWRDIIAHAKDESTGYVLPNKALLKIVKQMPVAAYKLRLLLKSRHP